MATERISRHEIDPGRREGFRESLRAPHPDAETAAEEGVLGWGASLPDEDTLALVDVGTGTPVRWLPGEGWTEDDGSSRPPRPSNPP